MDILLKLFVICVCLFLVFFTFWLVCSLIVAIMDLIDDIKIRLDWDKKNE